MARVAKLARNVSYMKISISVSSPAWDRDAFKEQLIYVQEAERMGADTVWTVEGWGQDAATPLAYLAARTKTIKLGTAIMQITARAPAMTAMTAMTLSSLSEGRFILGLGSSGPQIVEGLHGQSFERPLSRMKETIKIIQAAFAGEKITISGAQIKLPLPGGEGKPMRLAQPPNEEIPLYLATLGPKSLEYTGQIAQGWIGTAFTPERADALLDPIWAGAESAGRDKTQIDVHVGVASVAFDKNIHSLVQPLKMGKAFTLAAMGSKKTNFYNDAYSKSGWAEVAEKVRNLWLKGQRHKAAQSVPDEMVLQTNLLGTEEMIEERLRVYRKAGVNTLKVTPIASNLKERINTLGKIIDLAANSA